MGSSESTPSVCYTDNSNEINKSLAEIRSQINNLNTDLKLYQLQIDSHVDSMTSNFELVRKKFVHFDENFKSIQNEFESSFEMVNKGIKMLTNNIGEMAKLQICFEKNNNREHWEIFQNDWKENIERIVFQEFQKLKNMKFELELDLYKQISSYLLIKDKFNDKLKLYQERKLCHNVEEINNKLKWFITKTIESGTPKIEDLVQLNDNKLNLELQQLEKEIKFPPELDSSLMIMHMMTDRFEEIVKIELKLKKSLNQLTKNFANPNLLNPLNNIIVPQSDFAKKLYNSGIRGISQIKFSSQDTLLIANGYAYVPEYKYKDLIKKFIEGCESEKLLLCWELEEIEWLSRYLYLKSELKSLSCMINFMKNPNSIYQLNDEIIFNPTLIGQFGLKLWKALNPTDKLDMSGESNPIILYEIFMSHNLICLDQIDKMFLEKCGYFVPNQIAINNIKKIMLDVDKTCGLNAFNSQIQEIDNNDINNFVIYVVTQYIKNKKFKFEFEFNKNSGEIFFNEIVKKLLEGYNKIIWNEYKTNKSIYVPIQNNVVDLICKSEITTFDPNIVNPIFKSYSSKELKFFIAFCFVKIYNFYWNKLD